jgi:hypothetical protein
MQPSLNKPHQAICDEATPIMRLTGAVSDGPAGDSAELASRLPADGDRLAEATNDIVVRRLFTAGLNLEGVLAALGQHAASGNVRAAIGELDLAIRDLRDLLFDRSRPD